MKGQVIRLDLLRQIRQNRIVNYIIEVIACTVMDSEQARCHAKRNAIIQIFVATLAFLMMVQVFPVGTVQNHTLSKQKAVKTSTAAGLTGEPFASKDKKLQTVYFSREHLYQMKLYLSCTVDKSSNSPEMILFRLYNDAFSCIYEEEIDSHKIEKKGFLIATPDMDVEPGATYYYEILVPEESHAQYLLPVADRGALSQTENSTLYIDGIINDEVSLIADFDYSKPLNIIEIIAYDLLILVAFAIVYIGIVMLAQLYDDRLSQYSEQIGTYAQIGIATLGTITAVFLFIYSVILNKFGGELWDRLFYAVGILVALAWLISALHFQKEGFRPKKQSQMTAGSRIGLIWRNYVQTVSFGFLFYALCQYVNADRNFYHYTNTRWMLIFLAIAFLMNYNEKQFVNMFSAIWLILGAIGSAIYCHMAGTEENTQLLARLTCGVVVAWGLLILNIILDLVWFRPIKFVKIRQKLTNNKQQLLYGGLWAAFCVFMYVYRFEKVWVFTATFPFLALLFVKGKAGFKSRFLKNFSNGVLLSFAMVTLFCFAHRPYHYWMLYRYGGIFHTVACTGMYLAVVFGTIVAKLYGKLKDRKHMLAYCYVEYFVTVCVTGFILLTMSRTAFLTTAVTVLAIVILTAVTYHKGMKRILSELAVLVAVCAISFPMVFTAVRMVPAVVNDPVRYDIEFQDKSFMIYEGDPIDSDKYMTVRRFFSALFGRFQTQESEEQADNAEPAVQELGMLAYHGTSLAGMDVRTADSGVDDTAGEPSEEDSDDISNGRFGIFKDYIKAIGINGHPKMGPIDQKGEEYMHAHNSYLQVAYNFGMIAGSIFLVLCALTLWRAMRLYLQQGSRYSVFLIPFALVIVFGFVSLTEWAFHPCIPAGFSFLLMQVLLLKED